MHYLDALDDMNDIAANADSKDDAQRQIKHFCDMYDLDPAGFELVWGDEIYVAIAE